MENQKTFDAPESNLHFLDYWRIIRIRKTVILAVFLLVSITTTLVTFILPPQYESVVRIRVEKEAPDVSTLNYSMQSSGYDPYWIQTEFEVLKSKSILYPVITNRNLNKRWAERQKVDQELPTEVTYALLKRQIDVEQYRNTSIIEIRVEDQDKGEAADIANAVASVYTASRIRNLTETSQRGIEKLEIEADKLTKEIEAKTKKVSDLKIELKIPDSDERGFWSTTVPEPEILRILESRRIEAQAEFQQHLTLYASLTNLTRAEFKTAVLTASPDPHLQSLLERQADAEQKLADLIETFSGEHPDVIRMKGVLARMNDQVNERLEGIIEGLRVRTAAAQAKYESYVQEVESTKKTDIETAIRRAPYFAEKRDLEKLKEFRETMMKKITSEKVDAKIDRVGIVSVVDHAQPAFRASRPNKPLNIALGVVFGIILGVGLAFFIEYLDTSVKTIDDVERALQAPVLGVIPQNVGSLLEEGPDSPHAEAYRVLRTNVLFSRKEAKSSTLTVLSGGAGEGKSTTLFNLATIFAQNGARVLVVDSDLRRPSIHKLLKLANSPGLTNYLLKQNTLEEVIQTTGCPTLDFMPSGKLPSSSMGIISSMAMKELIRELKLRYDFVFFDSPPIMGVSDASILASEVDMVLQVIQYRRYPQPMTIRAKQMIEKVGGNLLGIVLNNINMSQDENYYYYSGYYYDYYSKSEDAVAKPGALASSQKSGGGSSDDDGGEVKTKY
ncbi:MAG: polysaccharide biosynthesis tyrosine autokinase [Verrucomicrobiales bacterium]|jgi:succinoglycan biosynthesis transport protein ExoP|nr:polysaccharide biosynthesis tyrosine autokinase [Verrucomicrobiales bacterium]